MKIKIFKELRTDVVTFIYKSDYGCLIWFYFQNNTVNIKEIYTTNKPNNDFLLTLAKVLFTNKIRNLFINKSAEYIFRKLRLPRFTEFEFIDLPNKNIDAAYVLLQDYLNNGNFKITDEFKGKYLEETKRFNLKNCKEETGKYPQIEAMLLAMAGSEFDYLPDWSLLDQFSDEEINYQAGLIGRIPFNS